MNSQQDIEIILGNPSKEIVLKVEEIPPLDVFYNPKHRAIVKRQRKRRKIDQGTLSTPQAELMNVVWKDSEVNPSEDLTKLSQYAGAYIATTMDKASEVSQLIKEKDLRIAQIEEETTLEQQNIRQLEQQLVEKKQQNEQLKEQINLEKQKIDQKALQKIQKLSQELNKLQVQFSRRRKLKKNKLHNYNYS